MAVTRPPVFPFFTPLSWVSSLTFFFKISFSSTRQDLFIFIEWCQRKNNENRECVFEISNKVETFFLKFTCSSAAVGWFLSLSFGSVCGCGCVSLWSCAQIFFYGAIEHVFFVNLRSQLPSFSPSEERGPIFFWKFCKCTVEFWFCTFSKSHCEDWQWITNRIPQRNSKLNVTCFYMLARDMVYRQCSVPSGILIPYKVKNRRRRKLSIAQIILRRWKSFGQVSPSYIITCNTMHGKNLIWMLVWTCTFLLTSLSFQRSLCVSI